MQTFVINLKRSTERAKHMQKQLSTLGIDFTLFPATDGKVMAQEIATDQSWMQATFKRDFTPGEVGCADSHLRIYEQMVQENIPLALILEDDVKVHKDITTAIELAEKHQAEFEWLHLDYTPPGLPLLRYWYQGMKEQYGRKKTSLLYSLLKLPYLVLLSVYELGQISLHKNQPFIFTPHRPLIYTSGYFITLSGAKKMIALNRPIRYVADVAIHKSIREQQLTFKAVAPVLVQQDWSTFSSEIGER